VVVVAVPCGRRSPRWGHHYRASCLSTRSRGENHVQVWTSDDDASGVAPSLEAPLFETHSRLVAALVVFLVVLPVCRGGGVLGPCWQQGGAEGPWVLEVLCWHTRCGGVLGDG
jgi:hypothetical protein